jgi:hypothetical protein
MAAPNIVAVATITAKTKGLALTASAQDLLENPAASGKVFKVNNVRATNVDGANVADVTLRFVDASPSETYRLAFTIPVPADAALVLIDKPDAIYLEEGDKLTALASGSSVIELVVSYEELS